VAKRPLTQSTVEGWEEEGGTEDWAVGKDLHYYAQMDFKKPAFKGLSPELEMSLNNKGHAFWNLPGLLDLNDL